MIWPELESKIRAFASQHRVPTRAERLLIEAVCARAEAVAPDMPAPQIEWNSEEAQLELSWFDKTAMQTLTFYLEWALEERSHAHAMMRALHLNGREAQDHECESSGAIDARLIQFWSIALQAREGAGQ